MSRPKKRLFIVLISLAALLMGGAAYGLWHIMVPGLAALHPALPLVVGLAVLFLALSLFVGIGGIVLAILGFPTIRFFYFWAWNVINLIYPIAIFLGEMMHISKMRIEQSFIEVSNHLVRRQHIKVPADRLMILTPHCLQLDTCPYKVTRRWGPASSIPEIWRSCLYRNRRNPCPAGRKEGASEGYPSRGL